MTKALAFIHIDTTLKPSVYKRLVWGLSFSMFILLLGFLILSLTYKILIGIAAVVAIWFGQIYSYHLLAISSLARRDHTHRLPVKNDKFDFLEWQLQLVKGVVRIPWGSGQEVWQASLIAITDMGCMMILKFAMSEPQPTTLAVTLWQDQVDSDTWRQLKVLAQ